MKCPYCGHSESKVIDSREGETGIRRRRECLGCAKRYTTYERVETQTLYVVKKDGRREPFDREKLLAGIRRACEKRPLPTGTLERMGDDIEVDLMRSGRAEVQSSVVGEAVMERLKRLDHIAYIRFASVYREFGDLEELRREVEALTEGRGVPPPNQLPLLTDGGRAGAGRRGRRR